MGKNRAWRTWLIVAAVVVVSGLLSAVWPLLTGRAGGAEMATTAEREPIVIQLKDYPLGPEVLLQTPLLKDLDGKEVDPLVATGILIAVSFGLLGAVGLPLALIYARLDKTATITKEDKDVQGKLTQLNRQGEEELKEQRKTRPTMPIPSHKMPRWSALSTTLVLVMFMMFIGAMLSFLFVPGGELRVGRHVLSAMTPFVWGLVAVTILAAAFLLRPRVLEAIEATDNQIVALSNLRPSSLSMLLWWGFVLVVFGTILAGIVFGLISLLGSLA